jgi:hypothetical protein
MLINTVRILARSRTPSLQLKVMLNFGAIISSLLHVSPASRVRGFHGRSVLPTYGPFGCSVSIIYPFTQLASPLFLCCPSLLDEGRLVNAGVQVAHRSVYSSLSLIAPGADYWTSARCCYYHDVNSSAGVRTMPSMPPQFYSDSLKYGSSSKESFSRYSRPNFSMSSIHFSKLSKEIQSVRSKASAIFRNVVMLHDL